MHAHRTKLCTLLALVVPLAGWQAEQAAPAPTEAVAARAPRSAPPGSTPSPVPTTRAAYCADVGGLARVCTHRENGRSVVCDLRAGSHPADSRCFGWPDNTQMHTFPKRSKGGRKTGGSRKRDPKAVAERKALVEEVRARFAAAATIWDVIAIAGAGPVYCDAIGKLECGWHANRRTPGYVPLARYAEAPGKKIDMVCTFDLAGRLEGPGACRAWAGVQVIRRAR